MAINPFQVTTDLIRAGIFNRSQTLVVPVSSLQEKQKQQSELLKSARNGNSPDWRIGGPTASTFISPAQKIDRNLIIKDLITFEEIKFQFVPSELDYDPQSNFTSIAAIARNNPLYHYTGSEDILKFSLDWFSQNEDRQDVILKCKKLEALSKNDGFDNQPHLIKLIWGSFMFSDSVWIVASAPFKLSMFHPGKNMLPQQAYQNITLKKVTEFNLTSSQIRNINS